MYHHLRILRAVTLACIAAALAAAPATAMPIDPKGAGSAPTVESQGTAAPVVHQFETGGGDQTLALVISGAALLVALGAAGYSGRMGHRIGQPSP
jgi:hypothetical protein